MKQLGIIADDLTGALDVAGVFATVGMKTFTLVSNTGVPPSDYDVLSLNTQTRNVSAREISEPVRKATHSLQRLGYQRLYKKIDSTMRGHVGLELSMILEESMAPYGFVIPAFPASGRVQLEGILYVRGIPLKSASEGIDDSGPTLSSHVCDILRTGVQEKIGLVPLSSTKAGPLEIKKTIDKLVDGTCKILALDAKTPLHLAIIDSVISTHYPEGLVAGSAGIATAMARRIGSKMHPTRMPTRDADQILVISGSINPVSYTQIRLLNSRLDSRLITMNIAAVLGSSAEVAQELDRVLSEIKAALFPVGLVTVAWGDQSSTLSIIKDQQQNAAAHRIMHFIKHIGQGIGEYLGNAGLVVIGGDTAYSFLQGISASGIAVEGEVQAGMPAGVISGGSAEGIPIVTKAGGFGSEKALVDAIDHLRKNTA